MNLLNKLMISSMFISASITGAGDIEVLAYEQAKVTTQEYAPSSSVVYVDGIKVNYPVTPIIKERTNLVPVRETFEAMGATVEWDEGERAVHAMRDHIHIKLVIDSPIAYINGQEHALLKPPIIFNGKTMVPLRFVGEAFGGDVDYNPENKVIIITMPKLGSDFLSKEQAAIYNIHLIENVEMVGDRRLMVSDNPETLNPLTIAETNATLWNDPVKENSTSEDHRVFGWHVNQFDKDVTIGVTIENLSTTNTIEVRDLKGIHRLSHNSWVDYDIGLPISEAMLNNRLRNINLDNIQVGYGETLQLGEFKLKPNDTIGFLNDFTIVRTSGTGELNYIIRTVVSRDGRDLKTNRIPYQLSTLKHIQEVYGAAPNSRRHYQRIM